MKGKITAACIGAILAGPAAADEVSDLRAQMKTILQRLETIEAERTAAKSAAVVQPSAAASVSAAAAQPVTGAVTGGDVKGSFKLPGSDTSVSIGGYVKAVGIYSSVSAGANSAGDELLIPATIPVGKAPITDKVKFHARESRLAIGTYTPTPYAPLTTLIEADFFGSNGTETGTNSHGLRIRHAWATFGGFSAGQYWSNLYNLSALPESIDFAPQQGSLGGVRQTGFRWTSPFAGGFWSVAVENPDSYLSLPTTTSPDADTQPDLSARIHFRAPLGEYEVAGLARRLKSNTDAGSANAYAVAVSGVLPVLANDDLKFQLAYGDGAGRYLGGLGTVLDAAVSNHQLKTIQTFSGYAAYRHRWTPTLRSNLMYSWIHADNPEGTAATLVDRFWSSHANLIWSPVSNVDFGIEYLHAYRRQQNAQDGALDRVILSAKYSF